MPLPGSFQPESVASLDRNIQDPAQGLKPFSRWKITLPPVVQTYPAQHRVAFFLALKDLNNQKYLL
jgi:hypothetical protein